MKKLFLPLFLVSAVFFFGGVFAQDVAEEPAESGPKMERLFTLPSVFPKTGRFAQTPWGDIILTCPNTPAAGETEAHLPVFLRITPAGNYFLWGMSPVDPASGTATPLDAAFGQDGYFYVLDNPAPTPEGKRPGRIIRMFVNEQNRPFGAEVVVYGMENPVAMAVFGENIYVLNHVTEGDETVCAFLQFPLDTVIAEVRNVKDEPHVLDWHAAQGMPIPDFFFFTENGTFFIGNSAAGTLRWVVFADYVNFKKNENHNLRDGNLEPFRTILAVTADDAGNLYILEDGENRIVRVSPEKEITVLAENVLPGGEKPISAAMIVSGGKLYLTVNRKGDAAEVFALAL